jgi:hypothetical protein
VSVPSPTQIERYRITFNEDQLRWYGDTETPVSTLLFCDQAGIDVLMGVNFTSAAPTSVRVALLSDEKRNKSAAAAEFRKNSAVISTWE